MLHPHPTWHRSQAAGLCAQNWASRQRLAEMAADSGFNILQWCFARWIFRCWWTLVHPESTSWQLWWFWVCHVSWYIWICYGLYFGFGRILNPPVIPHLKWQSAHVPCTQPKEQLGAAIGRVRQMGWPLCHCHCLGNPERTESVRRLWVCVTWSKISKLSCWFWLANGRRLGVSSNAISYFQPTDVLFTFEGQPPIEQPVYG
jgi:hypothetical protein